METTKSTRLSFAKTDDPFYRELRRRVRVYLLSHGRSRYGGPAMWRKTITIAFLLIALGAAIYSGRISGIAFVLTFAIWQFVQFLTTIGIAHDATHGAYSSNPRVNRALCVIFDLLGIDSKTWIETHIDSHHATPNVPLHDSAITSFSLVRLHPRTTATWLSRHQHLYMFLVYSFVTIFQVYLLEPIAFAQGVVGYERQPGWVSALAKMMAKKIFVLGYSLILPLVVLDQPRPLIVLGWVLGHMICGVAIGIIFQSTHIHEGTSFIEPNERSRLPHSFAQHILRTTSEFATESRLVTWIAGGLNLHVTHHLFPHVSQMHLPALSRIVRQTAREFGAPYTEYSLFGAIRSHLRMLKRLGRSMGPSSEPPRLGLLEVLREPKRFTQSRTDLLLETALRHGPIVRLPKPFDRMFLLSDPASIKRVLVDNEANWPKSEEYRPLAEWVGRGLITSEGEIWAADRRMIKPSFHREVLARLSGQVKLATTRHLQRWNTRPTGTTTTMNVSEEMLELTLVIIGYRLFGFDIGEERAREVRSLMSECQEYVTHRMLSFDLRRGRFESNMKRLRGLIAGLEETATPESLASELARQGFELSSRLDHLLGFLVAGHETTAVQLTWTLLLLAKDPQSQARASGDDAFLNAAIEESMRLYPPIPCFARRSRSEDETLAGYLIPRGSKVIIAPHVMHRLPQYWTRPDAFDPSRFLGERRATIVKGVYFPFGMGPRTCIGASMATMECRIILSMMLSSFTFEPGFADDREPRPRAMISLVPDRPVVLRMTRRTHAKLSRYRSSKTTSSMKTLPFALPLPT